MKTFIKITTFSLSIILILSLGMLTYYFIVTNGINLDESKLEKKIQNIEYYDGNDKIINTGTLNENNVSINLLNKHTIDAFVYLEDKRFFNHNGIDVIRIFGAIKNNIASMSLKEGASTISQQLIKNTHLTSEKTLNRKLKEFKLTKQLENKYTKNQILEKYLNTIYFGKGAYGIQNASKAYFNKDCYNLTLNESCILASIIKAPNLYSPFTNYDLLINRKNTLLKILYNEKIISKHEYEYYLNEKITFNDADENYASHYLKEVMKQVDDILYVNPYEKKDVKIYTYLDEKIQKQIIDTTNEYNYKQIVINSKNNGVIAYYGKNSTQKRQIASCIKPLYVYAPMINEKLINSSTVIIDEKINYSGYEPKNYGNVYHGAVTVKTALSKSLNVPSVKLLDAFGLKNANAYAKRFNVDLTGNDLTSALGNTENGLTLKELADCYSTFSNEGNYSKSSFIKKIVANGKTIYQNSLENNQVFSSETAYIMNDILKESVKTGTSKRLNSFNFDLCSKTGTNGSIDGNLDAYNVSYTSEHIIGVWLGNKEGELLSNKISGSTIPTMYVYNTLQSLYKNNKPANFIQPNGVVSCKIDLDLLLNEQKLFLKDDGEEFLFISGTQPTTYNSNRNIDKIYDINLNIDKNSIHLKYSFNGYDGVKINRIFKNKTTIIYEGNSTEITDVIYNFGEYLYTITPYKFSNGKKVYYQTINLSRIYYDDKPKIVKDDEWWKNE